MNLARDTSRENNESLNLLTQISPPSLNPTFDKTKIEMIYRVAKNQNSIVEFGNVAISRPLKRREYNCTNNLKRRKTPYCRETEDHAVTCYEARLNKRIERDIGKRYLRAGSISIHYVVNDNSKCVISNPREVAETLPVELHEQIVSHCAKFLPLNPVNRSCPENQFFHDFTKTPYTSVSLELFMTSVLGSFKYGRSVMLSILGLQAAIQRLPAEICDAVLNLLLNRNVTNFLTADRNEWSWSQLDCFFAHYLLLVPEYCFSLIAPVIPPEAERAWTTIRTQVNLWRIQFLLEKKPDCIVFSTRMLDEPPGNILDLE